MGNLVADTVDNRAADCENTCLALPLEKVLGNCETVALAQNQLPSSCQDIPEALDILESCVASLNPHLAEATWALEVVGHEYDNEHAFLPALYLASEVVEGKPRL